MKFLCFGGSGFYYKISMKKQHGKSHAVSGFLQLFSIFGDPSRMPIRSMRNIRAAASV